MGRRRGRISRSTRLAVLLAAVVVLPAVTLVWLGVRLVREDRELAAKRDVERRQAALQSAVRAFELAIARTERQTLDGTAPAGVVRFPFVQGGVESQPAGRVLWVPRPPARPEAGGPQIDDAEALELAAGTITARARYEVLARSNSAAVRAAALVRLARIDRQRRAWDAALDAYARLADIGNVDVEGAPADLQARRARCDVLAEAGRSKELHREALALESDWLAGRWTLDAPAWQLTAQDLERWTGRPVRPDADRARFSAAAEWLWAARATGTDLTAAHAVTLDGARLIVWLRPGPSPTAFAVSAAVFDGWVRQAADAAGVGSHLYIGASSGDALSADAPHAVPGAPTASAAETGLPWAVSFAGGPATAAQPLTGLLSAGLGALLLFAAGVGFLIWRVLQRELAVARLQSEFVAAVSHEFRTPLTSIRHITDLLDEADDLPRERRRTFYGVLGRSADRLQRLVESLLDFARLESGRTPYDLKPLDATHLVASVVTDFQADARARGVQSSIAMEPGPPVLVEGDAAALALAVWNLLDNAVKYSPAGAPVTAAVVRAAGRVVIVVRDRGYGIPQDERHAIFSRFVRGSASRHVGVKGTGLGLAIVSHVVRAHRGTVKVTSAHGQGSEFRITLPAAPAAAGEPARADMEQAWRES